MIKHNELVIDGVATSSFPFDVIVEEAPSIVIANSKTKLWEHDGISGAILQTNHHRGMVEKSYTLHLVKPKEEDLNRFLALFARENFWLESERVKTTKMWCYKVKISETTRNRAGYYALKATFECHPTKFFKATDNQTFSRSGTLRTKGSALAFPTITITGQSTTEVSFTVDRQVIRLERLSGRAVMVNNPNNPTFLDGTGSRIKWTGDFITIDPIKKQDVGIVLGAGISSMTIETVWGWA